MEIIRQEVSEYSEDELNDLMVMYNKHYINSDNPFVHFKAELCQLRLEEISDNVITNEENFCNAEIVECFNAFKTQFENLNNVIDNFSEALDGLVVHKLASTDEIEPIQNWIKYYNYRQKQLIEDFIEDYGQIDIFK